MANEKDDSGCRYPNCPTKITESILNDVKQTLTTIESNYSKLLEFMADYKVILLEIKNLKEDFYKLEIFVKEVYNKLEQDNKEAHSFFYGELKSLTEKKEDKANIKEDKKDSQEQSMARKGWIWAFIILIISFILNALLSPVINKVVGHVFGTGG